MDFCCFLISCQISPPPRVLVVRPARRETFLRQRGDAESFNCRHVTAHPPRHLSTPSVSQSASHPFLNQICSLSLGPSHSAEDIVHRVFSRHALLLLYVRRMWRSCSYPRRPRVTHPCRVLRVAKPFSADAQRRKGEEEGREAGRQAGRFMVEEHVNSRSVGRRSHSITCSSSALMTDMMMRLRNVVTQTRFSFSPFLVPPPPSLST